MGCIYTNDKTCKNEVIQDVEKIRQSESKSNHTEINSFDNNEKITFNPLNNQDFFIDIKYSGEIKDIINGNFKKVNSLKLLETKNLVLNDYNENTKISPGSSTRNTLNENKTIQKTSTILSKNRKLYIFKETILTEFNLARTNPAFYAEKLENMIKLIKPNKSVKKNKNRESYKYVLEYSHKINIGLSGGEESFRKAINLLRNMVPLDPLQLDSEINIDIKKEDIPNIENTIIEKTKKIKENFPKLKVHMDMIGDPELSAILQIVDDTVFKGKRREAILNPNFNLISLSQVKNENKQLYTFFSFA